MANAGAEGLPADGVLTGVGRIDGRAVAVIAPDWEAIAAARLLFGYLPDSFCHRPAPVESRPPAVTGWPDDLVPADPNIAYDVRAVIDRVVDGGSFFEVKARWAQEMVTALA